MNKFGIYNVRGGSYTKIVLSKEEISLLEKEITGSTDKCYNCNKPGHFSKECNLLEEEDEWEEDEWKEDEWKEDWESEHSFETENVPVKNNIFNIFTSAIQTFSNINLDIGSDSDSSSSEFDVCYRGGRDTHFANKYKCGYRNVCYRCGRDTHFANKCYAKTHINGYRL